MILYALLVFLINEHFAFAVENHQLRIFGCNGFIFSSSNNSCHL